MTGTAIDSRNCLTSRQRCGPFHPWVSLAGICCLTVTVAIESGLVSVAAADIPSDLPTPQAQLQPASSQVQLQPDPSPLNMEALQPGKTPPSVVTSTTISETRLTPPSLWWMQDQLSAEEQYGSKLLQNWLAYPIDKGHPGKVDLVVNRQIWSLLDYLERYEFIRSFGMDAHGYGYNLRVFDDRGTLVGASTCAFNLLQPTALKSLQDNQVINPAPSAVQLFRVPIAQLTCQIALDSGGKSSVRGNTSSSLLGE